MAELRSQMHAAPADQAMGLELQAIELNDELEWAESQGRTEDAAKVSRRLVAVLAELGRVADRIPTGLVA
jgi:hypothetical protein